ncbi:neuropeptide Y receptor type 5-like [Oppia nitens]|uniref:neuropeptide Y receptor type 5-like n=1 Tax=Oppia nitens TaxID=1686743 RepID=UPI0023D9877A|nr:neuropeptide Y receptor type 5-like [Oppia nitens]
MTIPIIRNSLNSSMPTGADHVLPMLSIHSTNTTTTAVIGTTISATLSANRYHLNNNSSAAVMSAPEDLTARNVIIISSYSLIMIISLCGNLLVCKIAFTNDRKRKRNTTNILIASLAISDIVMTAINIPFNVARLLLLNWPFGGLLCFLVPFIQVSCVYVSTFTMALIAIHRNWSLTKHKHQNRNNNRTVRRQNSCCCGQNGHPVLMFIIVIWLLAFVLSVPHSIFNKIDANVAYQGLLLTRCRAKYPDWSHFRLALTVECFLTQYFLPLLITTLLYIKIGAIVSKQGRVSITLCNVRRRLQAEAKRRRILMLALVVIVFAVCWLPLNVYYLFVDLKILKHDFNVFIFCHWFAMSSVCYNPFIYCWRDNTFREGAQKLLLFTQIKCGSQMIAGKQQQSHHTTMASVSPPLPLQSTTTPIEYTIFQENWRDFIRKLPFIGKLPKL